MKKMTLATSFFFALSLVICYASAFAAPPPTSVNVINSPDVFITNDSSEPIPISPKIESTKVVYNGTVAPINPATNANTAGSGAIDVSPFAAIRCNYMIATPGPGAFAAIRFEFLNEKNGQWQPYGEDLILGSGTIGPTSYNEPPVKSAEIIVPGVKLRIIVQPPSSSSVNVVVWGRNHL